MGSEDGELIEGDDVIGGINDGEKVGDTVDGNDTLKLEKKEKEADDGIDDESEDDEMICDAVEVDNMKLEKKE